MEAYILRQQFQWLLLHRKESWTIKATFSAVTSVNKQT